MNNRKGFISDTPLNEVNVETLISVMKNNPYTKFLRTLMNHNLDNHVLTIRTYVKLDQCVYNAPTSNEVADI